MRTASRWRPASPRCPAKRATGIKPEDYALTDIALEPDEAAAVAAAAAFWHDPDVAVESQTALLKLRAAGIEAAPPAELGFGTGGGGRSVGDERVIRALMAAVDSGRAVTFTYRQNPTTAAPRTLEPWGLVTRGGHWYVVGHDRDRADTRTFRVSRLSDVAVTGPAGAVVVPDGVDLAALVAGAVARATAGPESTATVWLAEGRGHDLRRMASSLTDRELDGEAGQEAVVAIRSRSALIRAVLSAGPDAVVLAPAELRDAVIAELDALAASAGGGAA